MLYDIIQLKLQAITNISQKCILWIAKALNPHLKASRCTQSHSGSVHTHSKGSHALNQVQGIFTSLKGIHMHSNPLGQCSHSLKGLHVQSGVSLTQRHSCALNYIQVVSNCVITHSKAFSLQRPNEYVLKNTSGQRPYIFTLSCSWALFKCPLCINCIDFSKKSVSKHEVKL